MRYSAGLPAIPSVIGGVRPNVRDDAAMVVRKVRYMRAEIDKTKAKLAKMYADLAPEEEALEYMRLQCGYCGHCSACTG
jgi:hypothetical protein